MAKAKQVLPPDVSAVSRDRVIVNQSYDKDIYNRLEKYRRAHGLLSIQEVDRLAVIMFLNKNGY